MTDDKLRAAILAADQLHIENHGESCDCDVAAYLDPLAALAASATDEGIDWNDDESVSRSADWHPARPAVPALDEANPGYTDPPSGWVNRMLAELPRIAMDHHPQEDGEYVRLTDAEAVIRRNVPLIYKNGVARPAVPALDVERLAEALHSSDLMRRYSEYADALPTMTPTPEHTLCIEWAAIIAREYAALGSSRND